MFQNPAQLGLLYFLEPDETGHAYGPLSKEVEDMVVKLDGLVGKIMKKVEEKQVRPFKLSGCA